MTPTSDLSPLTCPCSREKQKMLKEQTPRGSAPSPAFEATLELSGRTVAEVKLSEVEQRLNKNR